eukprot:jgi/Galph1/3544/GphlegSOOS_G2205.1
MESAVKEKSYEANVERNRTDKDNQRRKQVVQGSFVYENNKETPEHRETTVPRTVLDDDDIIEPDLEEMRKVEQEFSHAILAARKQVEGKASFRNVGVYEAEEEDSPYLSMDTASFNSAIANRISLENSKKKCPKDDSTTISSIKNRKISLKPRNHTKGTRRAKSSSVSEPFNPYTKSCQLSRKLSFEEETDVCKQIQLLKIWERERQRIGELIGREPAIAEWSEAIGFSDPAEFVRKTKTFREAKDRLIRANLGLVHYIARIYSRYGLSVQDLTQEGSIGLIKAAERFDASKGFRFSSYAIWWIKYAMTRALTEQTRHMKIPAYFYEFISAVRRTDSRLTAELGREPTQEEIFRESGLTIEQFKTANRCLLNSISLDSPLSSSKGDKHTTLGETVAGDTLRPEDELENNMLRRDLENILKVTLTPRERDIIRMRFGLDDGTCKTLDEISSIFCVTRERVRHMELSALRKLRHPYKCILLRDYISVKNKGLLEFFSRDSSQEFIEGIGRGVEDSNIY